MSSIEDCLKNIHFTNFERVGLTLKLARYGALHLIGKAKNGKEYAMSVTAAYVLEPSKKPTQSIMRISKEKITSEIFDMLKERIGKRGGIIGQRGYFRIVGFRPFNFPPAH